MYKKGLAIITMALLVVPAVGNVAAARKGASGQTDELCVALPVGSDPKEIHVGPNHVHVPGLSAIQACLASDVNLNGTPTVTPYPNCGTACFAVRVADIRAYTDLKVEVRYREDQVERSIGVDPDPVDVTRDLEEVCISNHGVDAPDPCVVTITSPSGLKAKGGVRQVALSWSAAQEAYGRKMTATYQLWRNTSTDVETFEMIAEDIAGTKFVDSGLSRKTTYSYYVVAVDENGNRSGGSDIATATTK